MRCSKRGGENRDGRRFCAKCRETLARQRLRCGASIYRRAVLMYGRYDEQQLRVCA
jgi:hypothetical protein